jgi:hypothetical protein
MGDCAPFPKIIRRELMKNPVLDDIVRYATNKLNMAYGYCGVASGDDNAILNSDDGNGKDIKIVITLKKE